MGGILIAVLGGLATILSLFDGFKKDDKISTIKVWRLICAILIMGVGITVALNQSAKSGENQKTLIETTTKTGDTVLKGIGTAKSELKENSDSNRDKILSGQRKSKDEIIDSLKEALAVKEEKPKIDIYPLNPPNSPNPIIKRLSTPDSLLFQFVLENDGAYAHNFLISIRPIETFGDNGFLVSDNVTVKEDESFFLVVGGKVETYTDFVKLSRIISQGDILYFHICIHYEDVTNKQYPPFHKIFRFTTADYDKTTSRASPKEYSLIKTKLVSLKKWDY